MNRLLTLLLALFALAQVHAANLGEDLEITPVPGWKSVDPYQSGQPEGPVPTLKFAPKDGRNAAIIISVLPARVPGLAVTDRESLEAFNLMSAQPYLPEPDALPPVTELRVDGGIGVSITNEDPALIGKPTPPDEYRMATTATLLLGREHLIVCTIFHDQRDSTDFREAMKILLSVAPRRHNISI